MQGSYNDDTQVKGDIDKINKTLHQMRKDNVFFMVVFLIMFIILQNIYNKMYKILELMEKQHK
jgi:hypothetical protein